MGKKYIHLNFRFWIFRFSAYFLGNKFSIRIELSSNNWD